MIERWLARGAWPFFVGVFAASCGGSSVSHVEDRGADAEEGIGGTAGLEATSGASTGGASTGGASTSGGAGRGGSGGAGGSSGIGSGGASGSAGRGEGPCPDPLPSDDVPCGGDLVGTWTSNACPLKVSGFVDLSGLGFGTECTSAPVLGALSVTGTVTFNADKTYVDNTISSGESNFQLGPECLLISGTQTTCERLQGPLSSLGYASVRCESNMVSGGCTCTGTFSQDGGLGFLSLDSSSSGTYTTTRNTVTLTSFAENTEYSYCASPDARRLALTLQRVAISGALIHPIVLEQE